MGDGSRRVRRAAAVLTLALIASAMPAMASVVTISDHTVTVERSVEIAAAPDTVWGMLIAPARWWSPEQSWSGRAANLRLDMRPGGCLCETLTDGGFVEHLRVVRVEPNRLLRLAGALGPLQADALTGPLTISLTAAGRGTRMTWRYAVSGAARVPLPVLAPIVDTLLAEQVGRLAAVAEGRPFAAPMRAIPALPPASSPLK